MHFAIEKNYLAPEEKTAAYPDVAGKITFHTIEAETIDEAVETFLAQEKAELVGDIVHFTDSQAVVTARKDRAIYVLQLFASERPDS